MIAIALMSEIYQFMAEEKIQRLDFVEDHCSALENIIEDGKSGDRYNIGGDCEIKNLDIV